MVEVGTGRMKPQRVKELLDMKKQPSILNIAPANGLFLSSVKFPVHFGFQLQAERKTGGE
jgi:tRNA U38,U39,U40 pseudouridine synthase TruA